MPSHRLQRSEIKALIIAEEVMEHALSHYINYATTPEEDRIVGAFLLQKCESRLTALRIKLLGLPPFDV